MTDYADPFFTPEPQQWFGDTLLFKAAMILLAIGAAGYAGHQFALEFVVEPVVMVAEVWL